MRLFISYARVDHPYCVQIAETLSTHEVWFDRRIYAGQEWWKEILRQLDWCEGFVYLLSPDSVNSQYCIDEYRLARDHGRHIFPVLISKDTVVPEELKHLHYADLSDGLTGEAVATLLNAIHATEMRYKAEQPDIDIESNNIVYSSPKLTDLINQATQMMQHKRFDDVILLLRQSADITSRFIDLTELLTYCEEQLAIQERLRQAELEYRPIAIMVKAPETRPLGLKAFEQFRHDYPEYDPDNLVGYANAGYLNGNSNGHIRGLAVATSPQFTLPMLQWSEVPSGYVLLPNLEENRNRSRNSRVKKEYVPGFYMGKYPVTNAQYRVFLEAPDGYCNVHWWDFSDAAMLWRIGHEEPMPSQFDEDDHPRENVCWYDAMAFCSWLSHKTGLEISLPSDIQWQRAARADEALAYPWGNQFDISMANTREAKKRRTTPVSAYAHAATAFEIVDMIGNTWEWCCNAGTRDSDSNQGDEVRAIYGGSFISNQQRAKTTFHFNLHPESCYASIGFRLVSTSVAG